MKKILTILTIFLVFGLIGCDQPTSDETKFTGADLGLTTEEDINTEDLETDIADINLEEDFDLSELESLEQDLDNLI